MTAAIWGVEMKILRRGREKIVRRTIVPVRWIRWQNLAKGRGANCFADLRFYSATGLFDLCADNSSISASLWASTIRMVLGAASYAAPLLSTLVLIAAGFAEPTLGIVAACVLITSGAVLAAKSLLLGRSAAAGRRAEA